VRGKLFKFSCANQFVDFMSHAKGIIKGIKTHRLCLAVLAITEGSGAPGVEMIIAASYPKTGLKSAIPTLPGLPQGGADK
jgi:hypothetical protein